MRRLLAIGFIWLCCGAAWSILGATLLHRSSTSTGGLEAKVQGLWGPPQRQEPPRAGWQSVEPRTFQEERIEPGKDRAITVSVVRQVAVEHPLPLEESDLAADLALEHRQKGLLWFPTYRVRFQGRYTFRNPDAGAHEVDFHFPLGGIESGVEFDDFHVADGEGRPVEVAFAEREARFTRTLAGGAALALQVSYRTRGTFSWSYGTPGRGLGPEEGRARRFRLVARTDFAAVDFGDGALSPSSQRRGASAWQGEWQFDQLVGTKPITLVLPERLNPGPLAASITLFAPVSLLFFFFVVGMVLAARRASIHPMNYFLLSCAFFAFHLLFAYLIDHLPVAASFAAASAVSLALVVSYARLFVGWRTAALVFGASQLVYLVLFSVSFFWEGFTGLAITLGAVLTLFLVMQLTGRLDWREVLARGPAPAPGARPAGE
jgi:hypothetical protein